MDYNENQEEIIFTAAIKGNKARPGTGFIYIPADVRSKMELIKDDVPMIMRYDKRTGELCLKLLTY